MIHYTPLPIESVFEGYDESQSALEEIVFQGVSMMVEPQENGKQATIVRVISSNPQDYLNPDFAPGKVISFIPSVK